MVRRRTPANAVGGVSQASENNTERSWPEKLGVSYPRVNELIHAKRGITPDTALRLEKLFGMEAQFWLNFAIGVGSYIM